MTEPRRHRRGPVLALTLGGLLLTSVLSACSGDDEPDAQPGAAPTSTPPAAAPIVTKATIGEVTGKLPKPARDTLGTEVTAAVDAWIDGAYGGDYPRTDFDDAFASFTAGAAKRATTDRRLMTNAGLGESVDAVEVIARRVRIDALARGGEAAAVTAHVALGLEMTGADGAEPRRDRVVGSLFLTREQGEWKIFGYDIKRGRI